MLTYCTFGGLVFLDLICLLDVDSLLDVQSSAMLVSVGDVQ
jgi:hypothetical protein